MNIVFDNEVVLVDGEEIGQLSLYGGDNWTLVSYSHWFDLETNDRDHAIELAKAVIPTTVDDPELPWVRTVLGVTYRGNKHGYTYTGERGDESVALLWQGGDYIAWVDARVRCDIYAESVIEAQTMVARHWAEIHALPYADVSITHDGLEYQIHDCPANDALLAA